MKEGEKRVRVPASRLDGGGDEGELKTWNCLFWWPGRRFHTSVEREMGLFCLIVSMVTWLCRTVLLSKLLSKIGLLESKGMRKALYLSVILVFLLLSDLFGNRLTFDHA